MTGSTMTGQAGEPVSTLGGGATPNGAGESSTGPRPGHLIGEMWVAARNACPFMRVYDEPLCYAPQVDRQPRMRPSRCGPVFPTWVPSDPPPDTCPLRRMSVFVRIGA